MTAISRDYLSQMNNALDRGDLITRDLKIVKRHGFCTWIRCFSSSELTGAVYSLQRIVGNNNRFLDQGTAEVLGEVCSKLKGKISRSSHLTDAGKAMFARILDNLTPRPAVVARPSTSAAEFVDVPTALSKFAGELCARIAASQAPGKSFSISPLSILAALGMALHLIKPEKKAQYLHAIGLGGLSEERAHQEIAAALRQTALPADFESGTIQIAQAFARKEGVVVADSLRELTGQVYGADEIVSNDLVNEVNEWVSQKTDGRIPTLLSDPETVLTLVNAIHLSLKWETPFERVRSWPVKQFRFADGRVAPVSMMKQTGSFLIHRGATFDMLEKPYVSPDGRKLAQLIFLPHNPEELGYSRYVISDMLREIRSIAKMEHDVRLSMPKIKMESEAHLLPLLKEMGIPFDDLDRDVIPDPKVFVSDVIHKTFVATDEEGTEAAAATAVELCMCCAPSEVPPPEFNIDHSFAYLIVDGDRILFQGRVTDAGPLVVDDE